MISAELHPEEMLDGARHGALNPEAALDLDAHVRRCPACHLHLQLGRDAAVEGRPDRGDRILHARLVEVALAGLDDGVGQPARPLGAAALGTASSGFSAALWTPSVLRRLLLPAACILLGGGVATAMWSVTSNVDRPVATEPAAALEQVRRARARQTAVMRAAMDDIWEQRADPASDVPAVESAARVRGGGHSSGVARDVAAVDEKPRATSLTARALFRQANEFRRAGDERGALDRYRRLREQFPGSREELTGRVIAGQLRLAGEAATEALREFDSYLEVSPNGTLSEEARAGRARALGALLRTDEEREAWRNLVLRHPSSVHLERARARLRQLQQ